MGHNLLAALVFLLFRLSGAKSFKIHLFGRASRCPNPNPISSETFPLVVRRM